MFDRFGEFGKNDDLHKDEIFYHDGKSRGAESAEAKTPLGSACMYLLIP